MAESPTVNAGDVISYKILSAGQAIKDTYQVMRISVDYALGRIPNAEITLIDGDVAEKDFEASNSNDFVPGTEIEIQAGYAGDDTAIFKGIVVNMRIRLDATHGSVLEVVCRDKAILMTEARKNAYYSDVKDSDIISTLVSGYSGLTADVAATTVQHKELVQYDATDWDFMMMRADVSGLVVSVDQGKVSAKKPEVSASPALSLTYGVDLIEFSADLNAVNQTPAVEAYSWDATTQKLVNSSASEPSMTKIGNLNGKSLAGKIGNENQVLSSSAQVSTETLKSWADSKLLKTRLSSLTGKATFIGSALAAPNSTIEIEGVGDRFSGTAFVSAVSHTIHEGRWTTEVQIGMEEEWFATKPNVNAPAASGLMPRIGGLMIGKVKQLDQDPDNENRILVKLPMMQDDNSAVWARIATFYATNKKGNFFIPEIDDEVVVGFLNSDPNFPIILGSLYSSKLAPPYTLTKENYTKAIVSKSDCKVEIDDEKKIITVVTPGKNQIVISDDAKGIELKDQNSNTITTDDKGINIKDKNGNKIVLSSSGIEISSSSGKIDVKAAAGDVKVSALNITNAAQVAMKSSGQASAEFSASGQTTVKGAMVMIN